MPVLDREDDIDRLLAGAAGCLRRLTVPASIAVVDRGSSDRTVETVDRVMARCDVPIRVLGCSAPGWGSAMLRGITTTAARWVLCGVPEALLPDVRPGLERALRLLRTGDHVVSIATEECGGALFETSVAMLLFGEQLPDEPLLLPEVKDVPGHAGIRSVTLAAEMREAEDGDRYAVLEMVAR
ncbi:glycosyltransferase family 2 protein [Actinoplanes sp. RD1]|uniref:glycosyltransferase family 2 protein n=1 Tax=Actinoplanes sp. RD1 TaxID=3064538 RepID=UPI0027414D9D|nr:glycosyltransferase [Actinoplanes sp. RD1]